MSGIKLSDFLQKRGVTVGFILFASLSIIVAGTYAWLSIIQRATNVFSFEPDETLPKLTVTKNISETDIDGEPIEPDKMAEYKEFPFEFKVIIGGETNPYAEYDYIIADANGVQITEGFPYTYTEGSETIEIKNSGKIKNAPYNKLYLRDGETAVIYDIPAGTSYSVAERNYLDYLEEGIDLGDAGFGCENPDEHDHRKHSKTIARASGWVSSGENTTGFINGDGTSKASFVNTLVPDNYEVKISSLVVVDRIVGRDADERIKADEKDIDRSQAFPVKVTIGDIPGQKYYYEVVHIDETEIKGPLKNYEDIDDYYYPNDPHFEWHSDAAGSRMFSVFGANPQNLGGMRGGLNIPPSFPGGEQDPYAPIHKPSDYERRLSGVKDYDNEPRISEGNEITVDLYHQSAVIIYGIPELTQYIAEQLYYENDAYTEHSTYKTYDWIRRDLDAVPDPYYEEYKEFNTSSASRIPASNDHPDLWRTRADIFNYLPDGGGDDNGDSSSSSDDGGSSSDGGSGNSSGGGSGGSGSTGGGGTATGEKGSLTITKKVSGAGADRFKRFNFDVTIGRFKYKITLAHGEKYTFTNIPVGTGYSVAEADYKPQGYIATATGAKKTIAKGVNTAAFVNEYTGGTPPGPGGDTVRISGKKTWVHGANANHPQSITVFVMNGNSIVTRKTVTAGDDWSYAFILPKYGADGNEITYSVNEDTVKNYVKSVKGYDITNTYDPGGNPGTGGGQTLWIWFVVLIAGSVGLRAALFYRNKRKERT